MQHGPIDLSGLGIEDNSPLSETDDPFRIPGGDIEVDDPAIQWNCDSPAAFRTWHAKFEELVKSTGR